MENNKPQIQPNDKKKATEKPNIEKIKKQKAKAETSKFKAKYFEYYDDVKDKSLKRQDWEPCIRICCLMPTIL